MDLYIVRHARAEDRRDDLDDALRALTPEGTRRFRRAVRGLRRLGCRLDRVVHSPWRRAVETAELLVPLLEGETAVEPLLAAAPGAELIERLAGERVAAVGHEPWTGELASILLTGAPDRARVAFGKGTVAWLHGELRPGGMALAGLWRASMLGGLRG